MKESKWFNNILDECLERLLSGETMEQCLQSYPEEAAKLKPLLQTALAIKEAATIQPRAEFRTRARYQFRSASQKIEPKRGYRLFGWQSRWATVVTIIVILLVLGSGTLVAAGNSMPDGGLYRVKLAIEQIRLTLTPSDLGKAELYARLADERVAEIVYLASKDDPHRIELVTQRLDTHLAMIASLAAAHTAESSALLAPPSAPARAGEETEDFQPQAVSQDKLRTIVEHYAIDHPARLRAILETAPESVKLALSQAISVSVTGYERVLEIIGGGE